MNKPENKRKHRKWIVILIILLVLIIIRLILPKVILSYANKTLAGLDGYRGHIEDIDLALIKGEVAANGFYLDKIDSSTNRRVPFVSFRRSESSIEWRALFKGKIVAQSLIVDPVISFTKDKLEPETLAKDTVNFIRVFKNLIPLKINSFEVQNGKMEYHDSTVTPVVNIAADNINILARNLSNVEDSALMPATLRMSANVYGGKFSMNMRLDPLQKFPPFDLNAQLSNADLTQFSDFFKAYAKIDISRGTFGLYAEVAGENRKFVGYVKPIIKDLKIVSPPEKDSFFNKIWVGIVKTLGSLLENKKEDQIATKIPIAGEYEKNTSVGVWYTILTVLRNAFIQALYPSIDFSINTGTVQELKKKDEKGVLKEIIKKKGKDEGKEEKTKKK